MPSPVKRAREEEELAGVKQTREDTFTVAVTVPESLQAEGLFPRELQAVLAHTGARCKVQAFPESNGLPPQLNHKIIIWGQEENVKHAFRLVLPFVRYINETLVAQGQADDWLRANVQVVWLVDGGLDRLLIALASSASPTLDLCCRELDALETIDLPPDCTIRNGKIKLCGSSMVRIKADNVRFEGLTIEGVGDQERVKIISGGSLVMERCRVEGGSEAAVLVHGPGVDSIGSSSGSLLAKCSSIHSSTGSGLQVWDGGRAVLEEGCSISDNGNFGVLIGDEGSSFSASHSRLDRSKKFNVAVARGGQAHLQHVSSDGSTEGSGWWVWGEGSSLIAHDSHASSNKRCGAMVADSGSATLHSCVCSDNGCVGLNVQGYNSILVAKGSSQVKGNQQRGNAVKLGDSHLMCLDNCDLEGQAVQSR